MWARPSSARRAAWRNGGAASRGERCAPPLRAESRTPVVATTDPRHFQSPRQLDVYNAISGPSRLTRFGGDCYCYTQLAMGFVDMVVETGLQPYDVQALIPLVEAAGGIITNWSGGPCDQGGDVFACGDRELHAKVMELLTRA
jgi:myo-inositol-1(or 4)-monophosphatase